MKLLNFILVLSLAVNVWLAARCLGGKSVSVHDDSNVTSASLAVTQDLAADQATASANSADQHGEAIRSWKDLATSDLKELIERLRAVGCPEETIQDIVLAEVNRHYSAKQLEVWFDSDPGAYWKTQKRDLESRQKGREQAKQYRELQREKSNYLTELLGTDPEKQRRAAQGLSGYEDYQSSRTSFLPESKRDAASRYLEDFEEKMQEFYTRSQGLWDSETRAEQRQLEAERLQGLSQFLTPSELREYDLRQSQTANQLNYDLRNISVTREQYEAIFDIRKKYGFSIYNYGDVESKEAQQQVKDNQQAMKAEMAEALGPETARDYERSQDYSYQQLARIAARNELPPDTANKVFDYKDAAEKSAGQLRDDTTLSDEQRSAALLQIKTETEQALKQALGDKAYEAYLQRGGWWINNLNQSSSRRASR